MQPRISLITLGVKDLQKSHSFYDAMGWQMASTADEAKSVVAYNMMNGMALCLFGHDALAEDAQIPANGDGFRGVALAYNVESANDVATVLKAAEKAGGEIVKSASDTFWGGHSGYFSDPDGHLWEVAFNPFSPLGLNGEFQWGGVNKKETL